MIDLEVELGPCPIFFENRVGKGRERLGAGGVGWVVVGVVGSRSSGSSSRAATAVAAVAEPDGELPEKLHLRGKRENRGILRWTLMQHAGKYVQAP